jgi:FkbM family methyltransferase
LPDSVLQYIKNTAFIDGGAAKGDSCFVFQKYDPAIVYSFEPSLLNQRDFVANMNTLHIPEEKYQVVPYGLAARKGSVYFNDTGSLVNSLLIEGDSFVELVALDDFVDAEIKIRVGFIKADLEGMGLQMLQGAEKTIRKYKPVLALSIYHNSNEFFDIYKTLKSWDLGYQFKIVTLLPVSHEEITLLAMPGDCLR